MADVRCLHVLPVGEPFSPTRGGAVARVVAGEMRFTAGPDLVVSPWYPKVEWYPSPHRIGIGGILTSALNRTPSFRRQQRLLYALAHPRLTRSAELVLVEGQPLLVPELRRVRPSRPLALRLHNLPARSREISILQSGILDAVLAVSDSLASEVQALAPELTGKVHVLPGGVDTTLFTPGTGDGAHRRTVMYVGRLAAGKGVRELLMAMRGVLTHVPDARLVIVGSAWFGGRNDAFTEELSGLAATIESEHPGAITFTGYVHHDRELPRVLASAAVCVVPSIEFDAATLVAMESLACGVPVVHSLIGGVPEVVGDAGIGVPPGDVDALAEAISNLLLDHGRREWLATRARHRACTVLSLESRAAQRESTLRRLGV